MTKRRVGKEIAQAHMAVPILFVFLLSFLLLFRSPTPVAQTTTTTMGEKYCVSDSDCVHKPSCCHMGASECINIQSSRKYLKPCQGVACTLVCAPCSSCACVNNTCTNIPESVPPEGCC